MIRRPPIEACRRDVELMLGGGVPALVCRGGTEFVPAGGPDSTVTA